MKKTLTIAISIAIALLVFALSGCSNGDKSKTIDQSPQASEEGLSEGACEDSSDVPSISDVLLQWRAGETVTQEDVDRFGGVDCCFGFDTIPDNVWLRIEGKSFPKDNPHIKRQDLRHIRALHWDYDEKIHVGEMIVNAAIAERVVGILRKLYDAHYPIERMVLPEVYDVEDEAQMRANNSSGFCYRSVARASKLSKHARGLAVDINTLYNPYYKDRPDGTRFIQPATASEYCDRTKDFPYKIEREDLCCRLFREAGFRWGGDFRSCKDYQHFEFIEVGVTNSSSELDHDESDEHSDEPLDVPDNNEPTLNNVSEDNSKEIDNEITDDNPEQH